MNKQEAIRILEDESWEYENYFRTIHAVDLDEARKIISQIDEPQKVTVPKFVGEWLKKYRYSHTLLKFLNAAEKEQITPSTVNDWILDNQYDFIKALHDGYEIEKEEETNE